MTSKDIYKSPERTKIDLTKLSDHELDELYRNVRYELEQRGMEK